MAQEIERYRAKVNFQHKFENVSQKLDNDFLSSPTFFARNIPFRLYLLTGDEDDDILCELICDSSIKKGESLNVEFQYSLISPLKTIHSEEFFYTFNYEDYTQKTLLSEIFPREEILVDDAIKLKISLWVKEPEGISEYKPPKEKLRQNLQIVENQVQSDAFISLLDSGEFADVIFVVKADSSKFKAHKAILVARSDVFARMLTTDMKEAKDNEIRIDDMGAPALKIMLRHIYTGQLGFPKGINIDLEICQELANAGEKYNLKNLKEYAAMAMTEFVSFENACELFLFAKRLEAEAATKAFTSFCVNNVHKIIAKV